MDPLSRLAEALAKADRKYLLLRKGKKSYAVLIARG